MALSKEFKRVAKYAGAGAGGAIVAAALLPVITVSLPVIAIGAAGGAYYAHRDNEKKKRGPGRRN